MPMFRWNNQAWTRIASGIEAGIVGGLAMLALLLSESMWDGHVWWEIPNLFGSTFYGPRVFRTGPGLATLAGVALHFVITGSLGALFGLAFGGIQQRGRLVLFGLLAAVGWYNLANSAFWPAVNPWVLVAAPRPATMVSHVLLGACLGYMGQRPRPSPPAALASLNLLHDSGSAITQVAHIGVEHAELESESEPFLMVDAPQTPPHFEDSAPPPVDGEAATRESAPPGPPEPPAANSFSALE